MYIKDGTTSENDWIGIMPPEHRLQVVDPKCGYIITANNKIASS
jgi:acyl-homoserine lactone acylase PvdQ